MKRFFITLFFLLLGQSFYVYGQQIIKIKHREREPHTYSRWGELNDSALYLKDAIMNAIYNRLVHEAQARGKTTLQHVLDMIATIRDKQYVSIGLAIIKHIVQKDPAQINKKIGHKDPVFYALKKYKKEPFLIALIDTLLEAGANPDSRNDQGWSLLHSAVYKRDLDLVLLLVDQHSANVNLATYKSAITPLHLACTIGDVEIFDVLMNHHADASLVSDSGANALHYTVGCETIVSLKDKYLTWDPFVKNVKDKEDEDFYKRQMGKREHMLLRLIVESKLSAFLLRDKYGLTAYDYAQKYHHDDLCAVILRFDKQGAASYMKKFEAVGGKKLSDQETIYKDETSDIFDEWIASAQVLGSSPLQYLFDFIPQINSLETFDLICNGIDYTLSKQPQLIQESIKEEEPIFYLIENYFNSPWVRSIAEILVGHGANVDACNENGWSLLHYAIKSGNNELFKLLEKHHADVAVHTTKEKISLMHLACFYGNKEIFDILLSHGMDPLFKDSNGDMAIHFIAGCGYRTKDGEYEFVMQPRNKVDTQSIKFYQKQIKDRVYMLNRLINEKNVSIVMPDNAGISAYAYAKKYDHKRLVERMENKLNNGY